MRSCWSWAVGHGPNLFRNTNFANIPVHSFTWLCIVVVFFQVRSQSIWKLPKATLIWWPDQVCIRWIRIAVFHSLFLFLPRLVQCQRKYLSLLRHLLWLWPCFPFQSTLKTNSWPRDILKGKNSSNWNDIFGHFWHLRLIWNNSSTGIFIATINYDQPEEWGNKNGSVVKSKVIILRLQLTLWGTGRIRPIVNIEQHAEWECSGHWSVVRIYHPEWASKYFNKPTTLTGIINSFQATKYFDCCWFDLLQCNIHKCLHLGQFLD